jgi:hypothetical protein
LPRYRGRGSDAMTHAKHRDPNTELKFRGVIDAMTRSWSPARVQATTKAPHAVCRRCGYCGQDAQRRDNPPNC